MIPNLGRFLKWVVLLPVIILVGLYAVANDHIVAVKLNPLDGSDMASAIQLPLYMIGFAAFAVGVVCGGLAVWNRQRRFRKAARVERDEAARWRVRAQDAEGGSKSPGAHLLPGPNI